MLTRNLKGGSPKELLNFLGAYSIFKRIKMLAAKGAKVYERSEDPIYVLENNIPIDPRYYLENQIDEIVRLWQVGCNRCLGIFQHINYGVCIWFEYWLLFFLQNIR